MDAFGIFEGGGAKGLAHIGALKVAQEERSITFRGVAGTSAGAIVAALVAAGYSANELYVLKQPSPETEILLGQIYSLEQAKKKKGLFDLDYVNEFFQTDWQSLKKIQDDFKKTFHGKGPVPTWASMPFFYMKHFAVLENARKKKGFLSTDSFTIWLDKLLIKKFQQNNIHCTDPNYRVLFRDIPIPLKIIATNLTKREILVFSQQNTPNIPVSDAVSCSISIPGVFSPKILDSNTKQLRTNTNEEGNTIQVVDGFLVSNFPAWVFDIERARVGPTVPTFGFRLVDPSGEKKENDLLDYLGRLSGTLLGGNTELETREVDSLFVIPLEVQVDALKFDLSRSEADSLYKDGEKGIRDFFNENFGTGNPEKVRLLLEQACKLMKYEIKKVKPGLSDDFHLRACVFLPLGKNQDRLRLFYHSGFKPEDTDDRLELAPGMRGVGECWVNKEPIICDLKAPEIDPSWVPLNKYQQKLILSELRSLRCNPILKKSNLIGVLAFDSKENLIEIFATEAVAKQAAEATILLADEF